MLVHPDVNDSPEAQKLFIELAEAYDILFYDKLVKQQATKATYWDTYTPPTDKVEYEKWKKVDDKRREFYKQKAKEQAAKNKQVFEKEISNFRKSSFFYPLLLFYYLVLTIFIICPIVSLCIPVYIKMNPEDYNFSNDVFIFMTISIVVISFSSFKSLPYLKKIIDPYFYN